MLTGRRFRLEFTGEQADFAERIAGVCRAVWNTGLEQRRYYRHRGASINCPEHARQLAEAKADHRWLAEAPSHCLPQTLMDLDKACRTHGTLRVRWRSGGGGGRRSSFPRATRWSSSGSTAGHGRVKLPKLGWVKFRLSRPLDGMVLRSATLARGGTHWFVSFLVNDGRDTPAVHAEPGSAVG